MSNLELSILKELDVQNISGNNISIIMEKLDTNDKKNEFLQGAFGSGQNYGLLVELDLSDIPELMDPHSMEEKRNDV